MKQVMMVCILLLLPVSTQAEEIRLTLYDDGRSCPGNCDAHVVFHPSLNGTEFAHLPSSVTIPFQRCVSGATCQICFSSGLKQCLDVMYRGGGPSPKTFDLTPAFYAERCPTSSTFPILQKKCSEFKSAEKSLDGKINCFKNPDENTCKVIMATAKKAQEQDKRFYEECITLGEKKFNSTQPKEKQRSLSCAYEKYGTGGPNSKGHTWRRLLPGACRTGTYVGRDGLDCCNGIPFTDGPLGRECRSFYVSNPAGNT